MKTSAIYNYANCGDLEYIYISVEKKNNASLNTLGSLRALIFSKELKLQEILSF